MHPCQCPCERLEELARDVMEHHAHLGLVTGLIFGTAMAAVAMLGAILIYKYL